MRSRILSLMARVELQRFWRFVYHVAIGGLGHMNPDPRRNGEERFLAGWAQDMAAAGRLSPVILDVGANEGDFAASILELMPHAAVYCFEPHPSTSSRLRARFAGNPGVSVHAVGMGDSPGVLRLHDYRGAVGSAHASFLSDTFTDVYAADTDVVEVPVTTVDEFLRTHGIARVDLAKVDVEGFERSVIVGMRGSVAAGVVDHVQFEFNSHNALTGLTLHEVGHLLNDYDIYKLLANGVEQVIGTGVAYDARIEIYKYANYVAVRRQGEKSPEAPV